MTLSVGNQSMIKASKYTRAVFAVIRVKKPGLLQKQKRESVALTSWKYLDPSRSEINIFKSFCALVSCQLCRVPLRQCRCGEVEFLKWLCLLPDLL